MCRIGRAGNHAEAFLDVPADDDLGGGLAVGGCNLIDHRVAEDFPVAVARNAAILDGLSYAAFVAVRMGRVNVPIT